MGIQLESIELKNIRSHEEFFLAPKEKGITVIAGENGTGKSSVVNSVAWALFGTRPKGVSRLKTLMRSDAKFKKGEFYAEVVLKVDDDYLKVKRSFVTRAGKVEAEVWRSSDKKNWTHESGPAVSHTDDYIKKALKMDEKGFLSAIFVQQKQVDQLITSTPKERGEVIEKLTGISSITEAINESRNEYNTTRKLVEKTDVNPEELENLKIEKVEKETLVKELKTEVAKDRILLKEKEEEQRKLDKKVRKAEEDMDEVRELENRIELTKEKIASRKDSIKQLLDERDHKKSQLSNLAKSSDFDELTNRLNSAESELRSMVSNTARSKLELEKLKKDIALSEEILAKTSIKDLEEAERQQQQNNNNIDRIKKMQKSLEKEQYSSQALLDNLNNAISVIESHEGSCPTCLQKVHNVNETVSNLLKQCDEVEKNRDTVSSKIAVSEERLERFVENQEKFELLINAFKSKDLEAKVEELDKVVLELEVSEKMKGEEVSALQKQLAETRNYQSVKQEYDRILSQAQNQTKELEKLEGVLGKYENRVKDFTVPSATKFRGMRLRLEKLSQDVNAKQQETLKKDGVLQLENERLSFLDKEINVLEKEYEKYKKLLETVETSLSTVKVLEEFREDRVEKSVPIIESYASEFLSVFTDGMFSALELDSKFNTTVVLPNGEKRPVGMLSGGELSTAALALRLAITFLLSSDDDNNLLILDEVLVSQDAERVQNILNNIKKVFKGQVVLIAHNDSIKTIADKVVEL